LRKQVICSRCEVAKPRGISVQGHNVCHNCRTRLQRNPAACPSCAVVRVLAFVDAGCENVCAGCAGEEPTFRCARCGREDDSYGARCGSCTLRERVTELLSDPSSGQIHAQLVPVFDALMAADRTQSAIYWLRRTPGDGPRILGAMARGEVEISHGTFDKLPQTRGYLYVRDLLAALGVLPPYEARIERTVRWLDDVLATLPPEHANLVERFARWRVLRHVRHRAARGELTKGVIQAARTKIRGTIALLAWLDEQHVEIGTATQADLEHYIAIGRPGIANVIYQFVDWVRETGLNPTLHVDSIASGSPAVTMSDADRWRHVERLLHDTTIRHYTRIGGLFMLLFAQPLATICRMKTAQVDVRTEGVFVTFDRTPVEMPEPLGGLIQEHMARRGQASYASRNSQWLFPGGIPGNHLGTESIRGQLVERGIKPQASKHAALFQLAATVPHPILADVLGISATSAARWTALSSRTWGQYAAARRENDLDTRE
jgi:hypothetical protein